MKFRCNLCSHVYDESQEGTPFADLPEDWMCPICGSMKIAFSPVSEKGSAALPATPPATPRRFECNLCSHVYDEAVEAIAWEDLPDDWQCPVCGSSKRQFSEKGGEKREPIPVVDGGEKVPLVDYLSEWRRPRDELETHMVSIHHMAETGDSISEPMRSRQTVIAWDDILVCGAQLSRFPLNEYVPVDTRTVIGPGAKTPLVIETPIYISHMSFGALSREAKVALSKGSAKARTAMASGEGGIIPESMAAAHKFIFEYVPNKYSVTDENLALVDAVEIKIGQSAKPGMGGHLPENKVTEEIAAIRGFPIGRSITSPASFRDIRNREDLKQTVDMLRKRTGGKPIGVKVAAGHIEDDLEVALFAGVDFITVDGRAGATGSAKKIVKDSASVPTLFALSRARRYLDEHDSGGTSLIITGGLRTSADFFKALALGADAVAIATAAMMALGCQQYRLCDKGKCPVGIATQDPELRRRLNVDHSSERVANFLQTATHELEVFCRLTGHATVTDVSVEDLYTSNSEISERTDIPHV